MTVPYALSILLVLPVTCLTVSPRSFLQAVRFVALSALYNYTMDAQHELPADELVRFLTHEQFVEFADELVREHTDLPDSAAFFAAMQAGRLDFTDPLICEVAVEIDPVRPR